MKFTRNVLLFIAHFTTDRRVLTHEGVEDLRLTSCVKAIDRRVARRSPRTRPIFDDEKLTRMREQAIDVANDHDVDVEKQRRTSEIKQRIAKGRDLAPATLRPTWIIEVGQRSRVDSRVKTRCIIGHTHEAIGNGHVPLHHVGEAVHILRAVLGAPLHADHICH